MKQFNLKEYLENPNRKVVTRDGRSVRIICTDADIDDGPIVALVTRANGESKLLCYYDNGRYILGGEDRNDLLFAPTKKEGWMNVFKFREATSVAAGGVIYESEQATRKAIESNQNYIATIKVEWEE